MAVVKFEVDDGIATVTLNRPESMNALSPEVLVNLYRCWHEVRDNPEIRVAIFTGAGTKSFCAGADLELLIPLLSGARQPSDEFDHAVLSDPKFIGSACLRDLDVRKPVIAAVNGFALAGGTELVVATDIRIAASNAKFGLREVKHGLIAHGGSCARLPRQIAFAHAMELLLTGEIFAAQRALEMGFVNYVVPPEDLMAKANKIARSICENGPIAVQLTREAVRACLGRPETEALELELEITKKVYGTEDAKEGPRAFMEKRRPVFHGR